GERGHRRALMRGYRCRSAGDFARIRLMLLLELDIFSLGLVEVVLGFVEVAFGFAEFAFGFVELGLGFEEVAPELVQFRLLPLQFLQPRFGDGYGFIVGAQPGARGCQENSAKREAKPVHNDRRTANQDVGAGMKIFWPGRIRLALSPGLALRIWSTVTLMFLSL